MGEAWHSQGLQGQGPQQSWEDLWTGEKNSDGKAKADDLSVTSQLSSVLRPPQSGAPKRSHAQVFCDIVPFDERQAEILAHLPTALFNLKVTN